MIFKISKHKEGNFTAKMDVPMQGAKDLPVSETLVENDSVKLTIALILRKFSGALKNDSTIVGSWFQRGAEFPLTLVKTEKIKEIKRLSNYRNRRNFGVW